MVTRKPNDCQCKIVEVPREEENGIFHIGVQAKNSHGCHLRGCRQQRRFRGKESVIRCLSKNNAGSSRGHIEKERRIKRVKVTYSSESGGSRDDSSSGSSSNKPVRNKPIKKGNITKESTDRDRNRERSQIIEDVVNEGKSISGKTRRKNNDRYYRKKIISWRNKGKTAMSTRNDV